MILSIKDIVKGALILLTLLFLCSNTKSQNIIIQNPSFEGTSHINQVPSPWIICKNTPDTQPGVYENVPAYQGSTYIGLTSGVHNFWQEIAGQQLGTPLLAYKTYKISVMLTETQIFSGGYGQLQIWGGVSTCAKDELLWSSDTVKNSTWKRYDVIFTPSQNLNYFMLACDDLNSIDPYILIDDLGVIYDLTTKPQIFITSPLDNSSQYCGLTISGKTDSIPSQIKIKSQFLDTLSANLNVTDTSWSVNLDYSKQKFCTTKTDTLIAIGYFNKKIATDTIVVSVACKYDSCNAVLLPPIKIPNLITPNNDGRNETFEIFNLPIKHYLEIYDRWGQKVFESSEYKNDWHGEEGVYYYLLNTKEKAYKGWVQVLI